MKRTFEAVGFLVLLAALLTGAAAPSKLQAEIDRLNGDEVLAHGTWGLCVMTADSGKIIAAHNRELSLIPASTMKVLTTGAALGLLGPEFRYETKIEYDGTFDSASGVISGNLYIRGSGDPTIESKHFKERKDTASNFRSLGTTLARMGVKRIDGKVIGDASCFSENPHPDGWSWGDIGQYYGAPTSGLTFHDNSVTLYFNSLKSDSATLESVKPHPRSVTYRSYVKADGKKDEAYVYGAPYGNIYYVYGSIPAGQKNYEVDAANPDPALQCAIELQQLLTAAGIVCTGEPATVRQLKLEAKTVAVKRKTLTTLTSPPLSEIVRATNVKSDNIYAEQLLRTLGLLKGEGGTTEAGTDVVVNFWKSQGVNTAGLFMMDGSGLSRSNAVTTFQQASILRTITRQSWSATFDRSLPVAGKDGSMSSLCKGTCAENNLRAKTGYINRARGYAGYVKSKSGKLLCFSVLANNYTCTPTEMKKKLEKILVAIAEVE